MDARVIPVRFVKLLTQVAWGPGLCVCVCWSLPHWYAVLLQKHVQIVATLLLYSSTGLFRYLLKILYPITLNV